MAGPISQHTIVKVERCDACGKDEDVIEFLLTTSEVGRYKRITWCRSCCMSALGYMLASWHKTDPEAYDLWPETSSGDVLIAERLLLLLRNGNKNGAVTGDSGVAPSGSEMVRSSSEIGQTLTYLEEQYSTLAQQSVEDEEEPGRHFSSSRREEVYDDLIALRAKINVLQWVIKRVNDL